MAIAVELNEQTSVMYTEYIGQSTFSSESERGSIPRATAALTWMNNEAGISKDSIYLS
jgi:hypothetical protein